MQPHSGPTFRPFSRVIAIVLTCTVVCQAATANSDIAPGVNFGLLPEVSDGIDPDEVAKIDSERISEAQAAGFRFLRLNFPFDAWTRKPDTSEQARVLSIFSATVSAALRKGMTIDVAPMVAQREVVCHKSTLKQYIEGITQLLEQLPDTESVAVEAMNEPPACPSDRVGKSVWDDLQQMIYGLIRSKLPHVKFVASGAKWGGIDGLLALDPTPYLSDANTEFTFHYYAPFLFTHQATSWLRADHANRYVHDLEWPVEENNRMAVEAEAFAELESDPAADHAALRLTLQKLFEAYRLEGQFDYPSNQYKLVLQWAKAHHIERNRILAGEFGVRRVHNDGGRTGEPWGSAAAWLAAVREQAVSNGFSWAVWNLDGSFGVLCGGSPGNRKICPAYKAIFSR